MIVSTVIVYIMLAFMVWAAIDKYFLKNRFGYGEKFDDAFSAMGPLTLTIVGIMCFAPILGKILTPLFTPLYNAFGADPAMAAGSVLASDMGGYALASQMTADENVRALSGILLGSMMGVAIIFVIPYTSTIIEKEDRPALFKGITAGLISIPVGCFLGGLVAGMSPLMLVQNLTIITIFAVALALALRFVPQVITKIFNVFSIILSIFAGVALVIAIIDALTGHSVDIGIAPIEDQFIIIGLIVAMLAGAYPFIHFLNTVLTKPLLKMGKLIGVNPMTIAGMLTCLASSIPMYPMVKDMDHKGKVMAVAFSIGAGFALGDLLGYTAANAPEYIFPMIVGKLSAGVIAAVIGGFVAVRSQDRVDVTEAEETVAAVAAETEE